MLRCEHASSHTRSTQAEEGEGEPGVSTCRSSSRSRAESGELMGPRGRCTARASGGSRTAALSQCCCCDAGSAGGGELSGEPMAEGSGAWKQWRRGGDAGGGGDAGASAGGVRHGCGRSASARGCAGGRGGGSARSSAGGYAGCWGGDGVGLGLFCRARFGALLVTVRRDQCAPSSSSCMSTRCQRRADAPPAAGEVATPGTHEGAATRSRRQEDARTPGQLSLCAFLPLAVTSLAPWRHAAWSACGSSRRWCSCWRRAKSKQPRYPPRRHEPQTLTSACAVKGPRRTVARPIHRLISWCTRVPKLISPVPSQTVSRNPE